MKTYIMSLYSCIDLINKQLAILNQGNPTRRQQVSSAKTHQEALIPDQDFLNDLKTKLTQRIDENNYENLSIEIELIKNRENNKAIAGCLSLISKDINKIDAKIKKANNKPVDNDPVMQTVNGLNKARISSEKYKKFQTFEYRIAKIKQDKLYKLGASGGECLGFTYAMVNPNFSPYKKDNVKIDLNQEIHEYQKFQRDRKNDQGTVKQTRLTREYFCPEYKEQAQNILDNAKQNVGKELFLGRRSSAGRHACYLSVQENGDIRYMDPNHGAFLFKKKQDFLDFYVEAAKQDKEMGIDFRFYSLAELKYDGDKDLKESKTLGGVIRTLLTGYKYNDNRNLSIRVTDGFYSTVGAGLGAGLGALIGSVIPVIGTVIGALIGAVVGGFAGQALNHEATNRGLFGLLGVPHLIQDKWQDVKEYVSKLISPTPQKTNTAEISTTKKDSGNSTTRILSCINSSLPSSSPGADKPMTKQTGTPEIASNATVAPPLYQSHKQLVEKSTIKVDELSSAEESSFKLGR